MTHAGYERLSALDNFFLVCERPSTPMHVGSTALFQTGPLATAQGGIDGQRIKRYIGTRLDQIPRYRQRLARIPFEQRSVWVDDRHIDLDYHVRHTSVPKPGDQTQLKQLSARILAQPLNLARPLWETWIVEGLQGDRFALVFKVHHAMIDGVSGADLLSVLLSPTPDAAIDAARRWRPRPVPSRAILLRDEIFERLSGPVSWTVHAARHPLAAAADLGEALGALGESLGPTLRSASPTPLNQPIGAQRRFDWAAMDFAAIKAVKDALGGTVNDVVLAAVAGAVRRFLRHRGVAVEHLVFRVFVPVSTRSAQQRGTFGNRVAGWIVDLPIGEPDPRRRFVQVRDTTLRLKQSNQARGAEVVAGILEWTSPSLLGMTMRLAAGAALPFNLVVTNVPGPPDPLYLLGGRLEAVYPMVPLFVNMGMGIALFSYAGQLCWGFHADWDVVPDLADFVDALHAAFRELCAAVAERPRVPTVGGRTCLRAPRDVVEARAGGPRPAIQPPVRHAPIPNGARPSTGSGERSVDDRAAVW